MNYLKYCILFVPPIILITEEIITHQITNYKISSLVLTNLAGLMPSTLCLYHSNVMMLEFIPFWLIPITSGTYHLCDKINYHSLLCSYGGSTNYYLYRKLDFINAYFCITTTIGYVVKLMPTNIKLIIYSLNLSGITCLIIWSDTNLMPMIFVCIEIIMCAVYIYKNEDYYRKNLLSDNKQICVMSGCLTGIFAFASYLCMSLDSSQNVNINYWWIHSFCWHIPIMMCAAFFLEAFSF